MCIGLHTLPPCLLFCGNYILHESEYDVHIFCVALDIIIYPGAFAVSPAMFDKAERVRRMSDEELVRTAVREGFDINEYLRRC